ncbi:unnamed protein product [Prorocentrum cordatum]|uniref:Apple domain-containing protein n=1 Tax=Prorocentrum cordatum TaxID=2364126 RepID=A0ABN9UFQ5_9DINO|nr:unnamed protein product [Polarella glacialis]
MCPGTRDDYEKDTTFDPVDMDSALVARQVPNISACQALCEETKHCFHFSFWSPSMDTPGQCHLQDIFALRQTTRFGFWSGPKKSWCSYSAGFRSRAVQLVGPKGLAFDGMGNKTYVLEEYRCMVMGGAYQPPMVSRIMPERPSDARYGGSALDCQEWCRNTTGCMYFSIEYPSKACSLAGPNAKLQFPIFKTVSGPVTCEGTPRIKPNCTCPDDEAAATSTVEAEAANTTITEAEGDASIQNASTNSTATHVLEPPVPVVSDVELLGVPVLKQIGETTKSLPAVATWTLAFGAVLAGVQGVRFVVGAHVGRGRLLGSRSMSIDSDHAGYLYNALSTTEPAP